MDLDLSLCTIHDEAMCLDDILDISLYFWEFVKDVTTMCYDDICETRGFSDLSNQVSKPHSFFGLSVQSMSLDNDALERIMVCLSTHHDTHKGVFFDELNNRFVFESITSVFVTLVHMVDGPKREMLQHCIRRMGAAIDVSELADSVVRVDIHS